MSTNYTQAVSAFLSTLSAHTPEQAALLGQFAAYLQGQATRTVQHQAGRPKAGTITGSVWDYLDGYVKTHGVCPTRKQALDGLPNLNYHTVTTQYQAWKNATAPKQVAPVAAPQAAAPVVVKAQVGLVDPKGQVVA